MKRLRARQAALRLLCAALAAAPGANAAELRAERIDEANADALLIGGPDAIGGVGDWYLANDGSRSWSTTPRAAMASATTVA
jgi:hypothetical protein